jgi:predicted dehydrogenase
MVNLALIGYGNIGKRHLESILKLDINFKVQVYDKFVNENKIGVEFIDNIESFVNDIDICIIATKSDVRRSIVEELLEKKNVGYLILEKVAFQSVEDFESVIELLKEKNTECYINCPLRLQPIYKKVKELINLKSKTEFIYEYSDDFKISSSFIHILDLFCHLCGDSDIYIYNRLIDVINSVKHKGFVDFTGELYVTNKSGHSLLLKKGENKFTEVLKIKNKDIDIYASEGGFEDNINDDRIGKVTFNNEDSYKIPFLWQSQLTSDYINQIVNKKKCELPDIIQSFNVHKPMINCFNEFLSKNEGKNIKICPIT